MESTVSGCNRQGFREVLPILFSTKGAFLHPPRQGLYMINDAGKKKQQKNQKKIYGLVNRKRVIATAEDKANITGYRWTLPNTIPTGFVEKRNKKGDFLYYTLTEPVTIRDVDGRDKQTIKTTYYQADKRTLKDTPKTAYGVWVEGLAGTYHGRLSRNWTQEQLTLAEIIDVLNAGFAFAPGRFYPAENESFRSGDYCEHRQIILFDGDDWKPEHPAPANLDDLLNRYPTLIDDFYWIGESISSRSRLKPELRTRLMLVLPEPIRKGEDHLWQTAIDCAVEKYPFIARGVGIDKVRLSFGNARPECENRGLGGIVCHDTFAQWQQIASEKEAKAAAVRVEAEKQKAESEVRRKKNNALKSKLQSRGYTIAESKDPIGEFCQVNPEKLLIDSGLATQLSGKSWNWSESSQGRSFELDNGIIKPFSNTMQSASPENDGTKPVNAHRFILYHLYNLDMTKQSDKHDLRCMLANEGYGTHPDDYNKSQRAVKVAAVREGEISPLELRSAVPPLPTEKRADRVLRTIEENAPEIKKAFEQQARIVGLRSATGDGKTETTISIAVDGRHVAITLPSLPAAEQIHERFLDAGCGSVFWKSDFFGYKDERKETNITPDAPFEDRVRAFQSTEVICVNPLLREASEEKGIPAAIGVCQKCRVQADCQKTGYLSQIPAAQFTHVLTIAMPKLFMDPAFAGFFRLLSKRQPKDRLYVIDEAKAHDMFIDCSISKELLQQWVRDWQGEKLGVFAAVALHQLEVKTSDAYDIAEFVSDFDEKDIAILARQASRFRVAYTRIIQSKADPISGNALAYHAVRFEKGQIAYISVDFDAYKRLIELEIPALQPTEIQDTGHLMLTPSQAFRFSIYKNDTLEDFAEIPRIYQNSHWTFFQQIRLFAKRYKRKADAPIWYHKGVLHWVIPPVLHSRVKHLVGMSATLQRQALQRAFDPEKVTFIETQPTHWVDGAKAFQVRTGAYPRTSLLKYTRDWSEVIGLSKTGQYFVDLIETEIKRDRNVRHVIITVNAIVDMLRDELIKKHPNLIDMLSFHKMEGLDFKESDLVFWILGCPNVKNSVIENRAKVINGNETDPLCYDYDRKTGTYVDERLQLCWQDAVAALLTQACGRARLNRLANTVIALTNVLIPDFTSRAVGFVPEDMEVAGGLSNLETVAKQRTEAEKNQNATEKKTARQREQEARDLKAAQKQLVCQLYTAGMSKTDIKQRTGISRPTIDKWLAASSF